jgi:phosphoribosylformylglycinamidine synthase subunit PurQ / glutaminase
VRPTVNVLYLPGTNCQVETMRAFRRVGATPRLLFGTELLSGARRLDDADILCLPGGFSFGDHLGAGSVAALMLRTALGRQLAACRERLMLCICNGFQIAVRAGCFGPGIALAANDSGTFRNVPDQPHVVAADNGSPWLAGLQGRRLVFPCAHGEGRFRYTDRGSWRVALRYPDDANPDGSTAGIAGVTTADGLVFGLMNHPERAIAAEANLAIFANGVRAARG